MTLKPSKVPSAPHLLCLSLSCIFSHCVPTRLNVKHFSQIMQRRCHLPAFYWSLSVPWGGVVRIFLDTIGCVFAGGVSVGFIQKSTSGASLQHVHVPLFILLNTVPGSRNVSSGGRCRHGRRIRLSGFEQTQMQWLDTWHIWQARVMKVLIYQCQCGI